MSKSTFDPPQTNPGRDFERQVAAIFRALGAKVEHDVSIMGLQIDILVHENTASGRTVTTIVECKATAQPVGVHVVAAFASIYRLLKSGGSADTAMIVSLAGFTRQAREMARDTSVELLEFDDLKSRVGHHADAVDIAAKNIQIEDEKQDLTDRPPHIFVAMPFGQEFDDVYLLGIREVAVKLGYVVERADEIEHNGYIVDVITERLRSADVIIADTSTRNPNVFYEVGYGHALGIPTILISRENDRVPFDVKAVNHIFYSTIVDLRKKLERRLQAMQTEKR